MKKGTDKPTKAKKFNPVAYNAMHKKVFSLQGGKIGMEKKAVAKAHAEDKGKR